MALKPPELPDECEVCGCKKYHMATRIEPGELLKFFACGRSENNFSPHHELCRHAERLAIERERLLRDAVYRGDVVGGLLEDRECNDLDLQNLEAWDEITARITAHLQPKKAL